MPIKSGIPVRVLIADDSAIMLEAVRRLLEDERNIEIVGEASSFGSAMQMIADLKPDVLVLDLHMPQKRGLHVPLVKAQLSCVQYTLAISFANDEEAKSLAAGYGAVALLDKMSLYSQLVPPSRDLPNQKCSHRNNWSCSPAPTALPSNPRNEHVRGEIIFSSVGPSKQLSPRHLHSHPADRILNYGHENSARAV